VNALLPLQKSAGDGDHEQGIVQLLAAREIYKAHQDLNFFLGALYLFTDQQNEKGTCYCCAPLHQVVVNVLFKVAEWG
jgi:hypothetical protein